MAAFASEPSRFDPSRQIAASSFRIRRARVEDGPALSVFAARLFHDTFGGANDTADMKAYLVEAFSPARQTEEIADPDAIVLLVEASGTRDASTGDARDAGRSDGMGRDSVLAGYAHVFPSPAPETVRGPDPFELKRFYVDAAWQGRGLAQHLMQAAVEAAVARGARTLWLGVWEENPRAIRFYRKCGFVEVGTHPFVLGRDRQTDVVMARDLLSCPSSIA